MTDAASLTALADHLRTARVLVVGDIMLDRFIYGDVNRISPESPVPVLTVTRENRMLGGCGNVMANIVSLGGTAFVASVIGDDGLGRQVRDFVKDAGVDTNGLIVDTTRPTTVKTRYISGIQQMLRADEEATAPISTETEDQLIAYATATLAHVDIVILSDYRKGLLTRRLVAGVIEEAHKKNVKVLAEPKGTDFALYRGAYLVTPNRKELAEASGGMPVKTDSDILAAATRVLKASGISNMIATRSQDGMSVIEPLGETPAIHLRTQAIEVFDVSGAGDTVMATVACALAAGASLQDAGRLANVAGGIVVAKVGTAAVRADELKNHLLNGHGQGGILSRAAMAEQVARWRAQGKTIGFTNGCFDILHKGHVAYLQAARTQCDRLIVGLNCDASVARLKGAGRPYNDETSRADVLAALACVDGVVLFGQEASEKDTPISLIEMLKPEKFFKGGDYTVDKLPEAKIVQAYGGTVTILGMEDGYSTTATLTRMQGQKRAV